MAVYAEGRKPLLGVGGEYGGEVYGAGALCAVKAPYALYRHGIHIHGLGAVAPAGRDGEGYGYAFSAELFGAGGGFRYAADGGIGYDHLYMVAVGVVKVILEKLFRSLRHGHYLALKALAQLHGASAAVDNGTDAYDRIAAYVTILCHIFFLLENCTLRHCRGHEFDSRGRIYLITHNAINIYFYITSLDSSTVMRGGTVLPSSRSIRYSAASRPISCSGWNTTGRAGVIMRHTSTES